MKNLSPKFYKIYCLISSLLVVILCVLLIVSVTSNKQTEEPGQEHRTGVSLTNAAASDSSEYVYVTPSGKKYHRKSCQYISEDSEKLSESQAISSGYTPCSKCNPDN